MNKKWDHRGLIVAVTQGNVELVRALISVSEPKAHKSQALCFAARQGQTECVKLLIPISDPKADNSQALRDAALNGHAECVKLLIPVSDPKAKQSRALQMAALHGHEQCVDLLWDVSDPYVAVAHMQKGHPHMPNAWRGLAGRIATKEQRLALHHAVDDNMGGASERVHRAKL